MFGREPLEIESRPGTGCRASLLHCECLLSSWLSALSGEHTMCAFCCPQNLAPKTPPNTQKNCGKMVTSPPASWGPGARGGDLLPLPPSLRKKMPPECVINHACTSVMGRADNQPSPVYPDEGGGSDCVTVTSPIIACGTGLAAREGGKRVGKGPAQARQ